MIVLTYRLITKYQYQPFACLFWNGEEYKCLAQFLHVYIDALVEAGLRVVATVCSSEDHFIYTVQYMTKVTTLQINVNVPVFSSF